MVDNMAELFTLSKKGVISKNHANTVYDILATEIQKFLPKVSFLDPNGTYLETHIANKLVPIYQHIKGIVQEAKISKKDKSIMFGIVARYMKNSHIKIQYVKKTYALSNLNEEEAKDLLIQLELMYNKNRDAVRSSNMKPSFEQSKHDDPIQRAKEAWKE